MQAVMDHIGVDGQTSYSTHSLLDVLLLQRSLEPKLAGADGVEKSLTQNNLDVMRLDQYKFIQLSCCQPANPYGRAQLYAAGF